MHCPACACSAGCITTHRRQAALLPPHLRCLPPRLQPVGTVGFMAPEVFSGQQGSQPAADMFAVGVCL